MSYSSEVLADSPLAYYRLGEASGTTLVDSSGNARDGTYTGTPTLAATGLLVGNADAAVTFDAINDMAYVASDTWQRQAVFTIEAIILPSAGVSDHIITRRDAVADSPVTNLSWALRRENNYYSAGHAALYMSFYNGSTAVGAIIAPTHLVDGVKCHVAVTYDGTSTRIYMNGALEITTALAAFNASAVNNFSVAGYRNPTTATGMFKGTVDEVAYYGTALSGTRIATHYTASVTIPGVLTATLPALTADLAGTAPDMPRNGVLAATLPALTASLAGTYAVVSGAGAAYGAGFYGDGLYGFGATNGDLTWSDDGYNYNGVARVYYDPPVAEPITPIDPETGEPVTTGPTIRRTKVRRVHVTMPTPTLVDGRPT